MDGIEIMFYLFALSAVLHFVINAGGGSHVKYWPAFVPAILTISCILVGVVPSVYRHAANSTETVQFDRGGCHSMNELDTKFGLRATCPTLQADFIRYDYNNHSEEDVRVIVGGVDRISSIVDVIATYAQTYNLPRIKSFLVPKCAYLMLDIFCLDTFRECNTIDCTVSSNECFKNKIVESIRNWKRCGIEKCLEQKTFNTTWCANIDDQTMADEILDKQFPAVVVQIQKNDMVNQEAIDLLSSKIRRASQYLSEAMAIGSDNCTAVPNDDHIDASVNSNSNSNITCDSSKQSYTRTTTANPTFNSAVMMSLVFVLFCCSIVFFGDFESFHFHLSIVRVGCCIVGLLMSSLVYIGSLHLYWSSIGNPVQTDADLQMTWRALYLVVSHMCLHGGLLVVVSNVGVGVGGGPSKDRSATVDQGGLCTVVGSTACCRRGSCCFKTVAFIRSLKEEFWDASGSWFKLKLMLMEMIELAIQLNSLASGATKSQVNDVVLSALIIAANLILLPLVIVFGPKCVNASSATSSDVSIAAVMVVEVLFDKLYVGVGVLYRYDTLIQRNMKLTDSLAVHLALLLPALMTALDVQDALVLAEQMEVAAATGSRDISRSTSFARVAGKVDIVAHSPVVLMIGKCGLLSSIIIGVMLATYTVVVSTTAHVECERRIGSIASCATEQYYFTNGFFQKTDCAFEQVTSFKCQPGKG